MSLLNKVPVVTSSQMKEVDRLMIRKYHITLLQMMENAGRNLARLTQRLFLTDSELPVVILAGSGGNGGGALVCTRYLHNWGYHVVPVLTRPSKELQGTARHQINTLRRMGITLRVWREAALELNAGIIVDGLIGYSLSGPPHGIPAALIEWANGQSAPVVALDLPSGMDADRGAIYDPIMPANATMTLALPKQGLMLENSKELIGELYLADIGVPPQLYREPGLDLNVSRLFTRDEIIQIF